MKRRVLIRLGIFFASDSPMSFMSLSVGDRFMSHTNFFFCITLPEQGLGITRYPVKKHLDPNAIKF